MNAFNAGELDAVVLNQSGSTGYSMHATDQPGNDGKQRHMLILQPDPNVDVFMQMLGRIHRTGQILLPEYTVAISDLAIEKRTAAVLMKKLASLNANTTAAKGSSVSLDNVTDFLNKYGDEVVNEILLDDPTLAMRIDVMPTEKGKPKADLAAKVTGRLILLKPHEVEAFYERVERAYNDHIAALDRMGMNTLEAKTLDLQAQTVSRKVLREATGDGSSPFMQETVLETIDAQETWPAIHHGADQRAGG